MGKAELSAEQFHRIAKAVADPNRFEMLRAIYNGPADMTCGCVLNGMTITAATGSHHLKELEVADLITVTRCGRYKKLAPRRDIWRAYLGQLRQL